MPSYKADKRKHVMYIHASSLAVYSEEMRGKCFAWTWRLLAAGYVDYRYKSNLKSTEDIFSISEHKLPEIWF